MKIILPARLQKMIKNPNISFIFLSPILRISTLLIPLFVTLQLL